jgi:enoyl-CoA hydratase/carnithine racemase
MAYSTITLAKAEGIATLTLNRPEKLNALNETMAAELLDAVTQVEQDSDVRVLIITGAGRAFWAGADVKGLFLKGIEQRKRSEESFDIIGWLERLCLQLRNLAQPTIAVINGPAVGIGVTLPLQCDIRIVSEEARFSMPFVRLGLIPEFGSTYALTRLIGIAKACELIFTGKFIEAEEAKKIGLVNDVVPAAELQKTAFEMAKAIAQGAPVAVQIAKKGLYQGLDTDIQSQLRYESLAFRVLLQSEDHEEGVRAFVDKRQPRFKGK